MLWATKECGTADFGDVRLTQRFVSLVGNLVERPNNTLPEALGKWGDVKAAYRFFDNEKVTVEAITINVPRVDEHPEREAILFSSIINNLQYPEILQS